MDMVNEIDRIASLEYAKKEGKAEGREEVAIKMKETGIPAETISKCTGLSPERIAEL